MQIQRGSLDKLTVYSIYFSNTILHEEVCLNIVNMLTYLLDDINLNVVVFS